jgi:hypothetical protein
LPKNQHHPGLRCPVFAVVSNGPLVAFIGSDVTLKIEKTVDRHRTTVRLIGRVRAEDLAEVAKQLDTSDPEIVLQLNEVTLVDVDVVRFLSRCELEGIVLINCSPYILRWMSREQNRSQE